jgi:DNA-binding response OmpR family regulator
MPDMTGFELIQRLTDTGYNIPAIFVTGCDDADDKLHGFDLQAEDYICKPYNFRELLARVKVAERHILGKPAQREAKVGPFKLLPDTFQVMINDDTLVTLTPTELQVLTMLMSNAGRIITRETFIDRLWQIGSSNVLDVYISRLRRKLGPAGKYIESQRGVGYVLRV